MVVTCHKVIAKLKTNMAIPTGLATEISENAQSPVNVSPPTTSDFEANFLPIAVSVCDSKDDGTRFPNEAIISPLKHITTLVTLSPSV